MADMYITCVDYIRCSTSTRNKIERIDAVIEALEDAELQQATESGDISEYQLDDGQTKIKTVFKSVKSIEDAITALEKRKQRLINRCAGSRYGLQDGRVIV